MGIVNLTPDSFSDGGEREHPAAVWEHIAPWIDHGIPWIDLGAESTRPQARPVDPATEWQRLEPTLELLATKNLGCSALSIDSRYPSTQLRALDCPGVQMINCVAGSDHIHNPEHLSALLAKRPDLHYVAMHMHGEPATMQVQPLEPEAALNQVSQFFAKAHATLRQLGVATERIWLDPGIGFGKNRAACQQLLVAAPNFYRQYQLCYGLSRKSFLVRERTAFSRDELDALSRAVTWQLIRSLEGQDVKASKGAAAPQGRALMIRTHVPLALAL